MSRRTPTRKGKATTGQQQPQSLEERAETLLRRLETGGPNPIQAAEELDRLQGALQRAGRLEALQAGVQALAGAWAGEASAEGWQRALRGDRGRALLTLIGGFGLREHAPLAAAVAEDSGLPAPFRIQACRVLPRFGPEEASGPLQAVLLSRSDPQVRAAAADALADLRDRSALPILDALLEEDLPRSLWTAIAAAADRLR